ncbi:MAG: biotin-(acetyl-CoA carboxylase) ligase [Candidatus Syntrophoarchaeum caldarius]|uniref:Biotin-(Acetyl-CoA carboxylase) ligase n=1 Tax=Candidatus Syntropharchaeum caldarium TaxID=1838285 RepID=A0A1F2PAD6_9EURY|nr:MAG: biotin-(acetyl-CoA carboxylase) ligase [Candidatus Syntrophoarchaeum caldarius]
MIAEQQTRGRGRYDHLWFSSDKGVQLSIILRPHINAARIAKLVMVAGIAASRAISSYGLNAQIKWSNDLLINEKKVGGILTEVEMDGEVEGCVVGIGININVSRDEFPEEIKDFATSISEELGKTISQEEFTCRLLNEFEVIYNRFRAEAYEEIMEEWRDRCATIGRLVRIRTVGNTFEGEAVGVDRDGSLILELPNGSLVKVVSGECTHL